MNSTKVEPIQEEEPRKVSILTTGLALFSMFFGAGNLIFPLIVGREAGNETPFALLGMGLSAVIFPFLGLIAMMYYGGNLTKFLARLGKWPAFALMLVLYLSQGPLGCSPRLVTLMHASIAAYFPSLSLFVFSILICAVVFLMTYRPHKIVDLLGAILTPLLLFTLALLVIVGAYHAPATLQVSEGAGYHFMQGLKGGYQTLDLIAALLFATVVMPHLSKGVDQSDPERANRLIRKRIVGASLIAGGLLMASYVGLCWLAAHHGWTLPAETAPVDLIHVIAVKILGPVGGVVSTLTVFFACLTTAISLSAVFGEYFYSEFMRKKGNPLTGLIIGLVVTAAMANLGFTGIMKILSPMLEILYPGLIVLCLLNIAFNVYKVRPIKAPVFGVLLVASLGSLLS